MIGFLFLGAAVITGCRNRDKISNKLNYDQLYLDYSITAEEGDEATCVLQFKNGNAAGNAVNIAPAKVELDGQPIETDSAKRSGFFYEAQQPVDSFKGKHTIVLTTPNDKQYQNQFEFSPFILQEELPEKIHRKPFIIQLNHFPSTEKKLRLLLLDTAFESTGFNDLVPVIDGKINISQSILNTIKNGPINLELYLEQTIPLQQTTTAGGQISISYGLKREFELMD